MNKKTKLLALVAVASSLAVGAGAFASSQTNTPSTTTKTATQKRDFKAPTGSGSRTDHLVKLSDQLWLSASQKSEFEKLVTQLKTERKAYHEQRKSASTQEAKEKLQTQREQRKTELKTQILALVPAEQKSKVESLLSKPKHWDHKGERKERRKPKSNSDSTTTNSATVSSAKKQRTTTASVQS